MPNCTLTSKTVLECAIASQDTLTIHTLLTVGADIRQISSQSSAMLAELGLCLDDLMPIETPGVAGQLLDSSLFGMNVLV